jgi:LmbE family N-acetylglucosaminyl deacetylase
MNPIARAALGPEVRPDDRLLVLAPHPDDESLATGGILRRASALGARAKILFVTDGENNPWPQRAVEGRWRIRASDRERWGRRRRGEALAAISCLGLAEESVRFLGYPDRGLCDLLMSDPDGLLRELVAEIAAWEPTILVDPAPEDRHPDHGALAVLTDMALAQPAVSAIRPTRLRYVIHGTLPGAPLLQTLHLAKPELERKRSAIRMHRSQLRFGAQRFLRFAQPEEHFLPITHVKAVDDGHEVHSGHFDRGVLHLGIGRRRAGIGPLVVRVVAVAEDGSSTRAEIRVPPRGVAAPVRNTATGEVTESILVTRDGGEQRLALRIGNSGPPAMAYVKLARPAERRLGFFDALGWRAAQVARPSHRESAEGEPLTAAVGREECPVH